MDKKANNDPQNTTQQTKDTNDTNIRGDIWYSGRTRRNKNKLNFKIKIIVLVCWWSLLLYMDCTLSSVQGSWHYSNNHFRLVLTTSCVYDFPHMTNVLPFRGSCT